MFSRTSSSTLLSFERILAILGPLHIYLKFSVILSLSTYHTYMQKTCWGFGLDLHGIYRAILSYCFLIREHDIYLGPLWFLSMFIIFSRKSFTTFEIVFIDIWCFHIVNFYRLHFVFKNTTDICVSILYLAIVSNIYYL